MDMHKLIVDELKRQGRSKYWLAESPGCGINQNTVYAYLRGDGDTTGRTLGAMLEALRLQIVPDPNRMA